MSLKLLFQGDSITDASRHRDNPNHLGYGYVSIIAAHLMTQSPKRTFTYLNRGISGNRTKNLISEWQEGCIDLKPDVFSLYIGVNNTWRRYDKNDPTSAEVFEIEMRQLLESTFNQTPASPEKSILIEPFVLDQPAGTKAHWREEDLDAKAAIINSLAKEYGTSFLPLQSIFDQALNQAPPAFWAEDGVHPTPAGHALIAQEWLKVMAPLLAES